MLVNLAYYSYLELPALYPVVYISANGKLVENVVEASTEGWYTVYDPEESPIENGQRHITAVYRTVGETVEIELDLDQIHEFLVDIHSELTGSDGKEKLQALSASLEAMPEEEPDDYEDDEPEETLVNVEVKTRVLVNHTYLYGD